MDTLTKPVTVTCLHCGARLTGIIDQQAHRCPPTITKARELYAAACLAWDVEAEAGEYAYEYRQWLLGADIHEPEPPDAMRLLEGRNAVVQLRELGRGQDLLNAIAVARQDNHQDPPEARIQRARDVALACAVEMEVRNG